MIVLLVSPQGRGIGGGEVVYNTVRHTLIKHLHTRNLTVIECTLYKQYGYAKQLAPNTRTTAIKSNIELLPKKIKELISKTNEEKIIFLDKISDVKALKFVHELRDTVNGLIVYLHGPPTIWDPTVMNYLKSLILNIKHTIDNMPHSFPRTSFTRVISKYLDQGRNVLLIANSELTKDISLKILHDNIKQEVRTTVIRPPIKSVPCKQHWYKSLTRRLHKISESRELTIGCLSKFVSEKRLHEVLIFARNLQKLGYKVKVKLIGAAHSYSSRCYAKKLSIQAKLMKIDLSLYMNVDEHTKEKLLSTFNLGVYPAKYEPFGLAALETLACGIPIITHITYGLLLDIAKDSHIILPHFRSINEIKDNLLNYFIKIYSDKMVRESLYEFLSTCSRSIFETNILQAFTFKLI